MSAPQKLRTVDDTMTITGRGRVITTNRWEGGELNVGDWIELRSADGTSNSARIKSIDTVRWTPNAERAASTAGRYAFTLAQVHRDKVKQGDEVWSVVEQPTEVPQKQ